MRNRVIRLAITCSAAVLISTGLNFIVHAKSWKQTLLATQVNDFNKLYHNLPNELAYALKGAELEELQQTLNSYSGTFGLVITNCQREAKECPEQQILYMSEPNLAWKDNLKHLEKHPYELVRSRIPLLAKESSPQGDYQGGEITSNIQPGEIIGRVYYVHSISSSFLKDYGSWILNPFEDKGVRLIYSLSVALSLVGGLTSWAVLESILHKQRIQNKLFEQREQRLSWDIQTLRFQLSEQVNQGEYLESQRNDERQQAFIVQQQVALLQAQLAQGRRDAQRTQQEILQLQTQLNEAETQVQGNELIITQLKNQLEESREQGRGYQQRIIQLQTLLDETGEQVAEAKQTIIQLQKQLTQNQVEQQVNQQTIAFLQEEVLVKGILQQELQQHQLRETQYLIQINYLLNQLEQQKREEVEYIEYLEQEDKRLQQVLKCSQQQVAGHSIQIAALEAEKNSLLEQLRQTNRKLEIQQRFIPADFDLKPTESRKHYTLWVAHIKDLDHLQDRIFVQVMSKILSLQSEPRPHDARQLNRYGYRDVYRVKTGEYRICYTIHTHPEQSAGEVRVLMIGKRNDKEIYEELLRRLG